MIDPVRNASLRRAMTRLATKAESFSGHCFRCVKPRYSSRLDAFSGEGSRKTSGRYHVKGQFAITYTSTELQTAEWEYLNTARSLGIDIAFLLPFTAIGADVVLSQVLNLNHPAVRRTLKVTLAELRASKWDGTSEETLTQAIGRHAYEAGFEAIRVPSAGSGQNLNIFRQKLRADSYIKIVNEGDLPLL